MMLKKLSLWVSLSAAALSSSAPAFAACHIEQFEQLGQELDSVESALRLAQRRIGALSIALDTEFVGVIWQDKSGYSITSAQGCAGSDDFQFWLQPRAAATVVALWHTHGAPGPFRRMFSAADGELVRRTGLSSYLITDNGGIKVLSADSLPDRPQQLRSFGSRTIVHKGYKGRWLRSEALASRR